MCISFHGWGIYAVNALVYCKAEFRPCSDGLDAFFVVGVLEVVKKSTRV